MFILRTIHTAKYNLEANISSRLTCKTGNICRKNVWRIIIRVTWGIFLKTGRTNRWELQFCCFLSVSVSLLLFRGISSPVKWKRLSRKLRSPSRGLRFILNALDSERCGASRHVRDTVGPDLNFQADLKIDSTWKSEPRGQGEGLDGSAIAIHTGYC